ncbi:MAG: deaminase [Pseudolabrys sp.]
MRIWNRRSILAALSGIVPFVGHRGEAAPASEHARFVEQAFAMKRKAIDNGDQAYGAVVVRAGEIVGFGPSNVRERGEWVGHAEREAMRDAQGRLGRADLFDCVMYSTSPPCSRCQGVAAQAQLSRMFAGPDATDLGPPRPVR